MPQTKLLPALLSLSAVGVIVYGSRGSLGLFIEPWEASFGETRGTVSLISAIGFIMFAVGQPIAGRLLETRNPRWVIAGGLCLMALGFGASATATNVWMAVILIGVLASFGTGLASLSALNYVAGELLTRRHGLIFGVLTAAGAGGQVLILPLATAALGISLSAGLLAISALCALGAVAAVVLIPPIAPADSQALAGRWSAMTKNVNFWRLAVPYAICGFTTTGLIDTHFIPHAHDYGISISRASSALATLSAFNVLGVLVGGSITDRVDRGKMLAAIYLSRGAILLSLPYLTNPTGIFLFAALFGLADFVTVPPTTSLARSTFPTGWALPLGILGAAHELGSAAGASLGGWSHDLTGSYQTILVTSSLLLLVATALSWQTRTRRRPAPAAS